MNNQLLHFALVRKELHLMTDLICNCYIIMEVFKNRENLLLKDIYLSLQDIDEIISGELVNFLEEKI